MLIKLGITFFCGLLFLSEACGSKIGGEQTLSRGAATTQPAQSLQPEAARSNQTKQPTASTGEQAAKPLLDACSLLTNSEIAAVQGGRVQSAVPSQQASGEFAVSQCYYTVASSDRTKNLSVHLQVIQAGPQNSRRNAVREFWERKFEGKEGEGEREEEEEEEKGEAGKPQSIHGIGDEALWFGNSLVGSLYVLKKDKLVRISVGGHTDGKVRIEKSKTLAAKALKRLS